MDVATPTADCLTIVHDLLLPVIMKGRSKSTLSHQEVTLVNRIESDISHIADWTLMLSCVSKIPSYSVTSLSSKLYSTSVFFIKAWPTICSHLSPKYWLCTMFACYLQNRILGEVEDQIEQIFALVFENYKSLDESTPSGIMDVFKPATGVVPPALEPAVKLYSLLHDILSPEAQNTLYSYFQVWKLAHISLYLLFLICSFWH